MVTNFNPFLDRISRQDLLSIQKSLKETSTPLNKDQQEKVKQIFLNMNLKMDSYSKQLFSGFIEKSIFQLSKKIYYHFYKRQSVNLVAKAIDYYVFFPNSNQTFKTDFLKDVYSEVESQVSGSFYRIERDELNKFKCQAALNHLEKYLEADLLSLFLEDLSILCDQELSFYLTNDQKNVIQAKLTEMFDADTAVQLTLSLTLKLCHIYESRFKVFQSWLNKDPLFELNNQLPPNKVKEFICSVCEEVKKEAKQKNEVLSEKSFQEMKAKAAVNLADRYIQKDFISKILQQFFSFIDQSKPFSAENPDWTSLENELQKLFDADTASILKNKIIQAFKEHRASQLALSQAQLPSTINSGPSEAELKAIQKKQKLKESASSVYNGLQALQEPFNDIYQTIENQLTSSENRLKINSENIQTILQLFDQQIVEKDIDQYLQDLGNLKQTLEESYSNCIKLMLKAYTYHVEWRALEKLKDGKEVLQEFGQLSDFGIVEKPWPDKANELKLKLEDQKAEIDQLMTSTKEKIELKRKVWRKKETLVQDPNSALATNPFVNFKYAFKCLADQNEDYQDFFVPIFKLISYLCSVDTNQANDSFNRWTEFFSQVANLWKEAGSDQYVNDELFLRFINEDQIQALLSNVCKSLSQLAKFDLSLNSILSDLKNTDLSLIAKLDFKQALAAVFNWQIVGQDSTKTNQEDDIIFIWLEKISGLKQEIFSKQTDANNLLSAVLTKEMQQQWPPSIQFLWVCLALSLKLDPVLEATKISPADPIFKDWQVELLKERQIIEKALKSTKSLSTELGLINFALRFTPFSVKGILTKILTVIKKLVPFNKIKKSIKPDLEENFLKKLQDKAILVDQEQVEPELLKEALDLSRKAPRQKMGLAFVDFFLQEWQPLVNHIIEKFLSNDQLTIKLLCEAKELLEIYQKFLQARINLIDTLYYSNTASEYKQQALNQEVELSLELFSKILVITQLGADLIKDSPTNKKLVEGLDSVLSHIKDQTLPARGEQMIWLKKFVFADLSSHLPLT